jgi:hypothetical protein
MDAVNSYNTTTTSAVDAVFQKDEQIRVIAKDALLQFNALDYCIFREFGEIVDYLNEGKNPTDYDFPEDPYDISEYIGRLDEYIGGLDDVSKLNGLNHYRNYVIFLALQEVWSYALAFPQIVYDMRNVQPIEVREGYSCTCEVTDSRVNKKDIHLSGKTKQAIKMKISKQLKGSLESIPEEIIDLCATIALVVGNLPGTDDIDEAQVVRFLFAGKRDEINEDDITIEEKVGLTPDDQEMVTVDVIGAIKNYLPGETVAEIAIGNSTFLNSLTNSWKRLFPADQGQTQFFGMLYDKITRLEDSLRASKPSESQVDYQHEVLEITLKKLEKWKIEKRMEELWNLSRDISADSVLTALRSLDKINLIEEQKKEVR